MNLFTLAAHNLFRKPFRTAALVLAVGIATAAVFATATLMHGIERSVDHGFSKLGADLMVVPRGTMVGMERALLTGEPSTFYMQADLAEEVGALQGVNTVASQLFLTTADAEHCIVGDAFLVGFDRENDFTVMPWVNEHLNREMQPGDVVVGGASQFELGESVYYYGRYFTVYGKLDRTGIGLSDNAIFLDLADAYALAEASRDYDDVELGFGPGDISAVLVRLEGGANADHVRFALAQNPNISVVTAGNVVTGVRQNVVALFAGTALLTGVLILGNILMISAIFSTIINERRRELGLLRAIGARKGRVFNLVLTESAMLGAAGGLAGVALGLVLLRMFSRTIGFHLELLNIPFLWPPVENIALMGGAAVLMALLVATLGASYPAVSGARLEPYDAIRAGE
ncbi:ABC transporter permease [Thioalkalivibrio paradoxus]|uniref:ABC transporter permease n=1 Tax=Thioalkalivibrio paradoxus TaxID=108010 RepID=UPI00022C2710|nr:ABC transporter permease [Thioalkalivibrio paradoxus]